MGNCEIQSGLPALPVSTHLPALSPLRALSRMKLKHLQWSVPFVVGWWGHPWHCTIRTACIERISHFFIYFLSSSPPRVFLKPEVPKPIDIAHTAIPRERVLRWRCGGPVAITKRTGQTRVLLVVQRKLSIYFLGLLRQVICCFHAAMSSFLKGD